MKVDNNLILTLSKLAKLNFDKETIIEMKSDLKKILAFIDKLSEIDTEGVEPLIYLSDEVNMLRSDEIDDEVSQEQALQNAPEKDSDYFKVPTVLKK
tara:strand:+ start:80 stop:370 length:291 start_codon:yes stop_codon:yes gene_type:complete